MSEFTFTPAPKRRWFRWSLRTLFVVVTAFAWWLGVTLAMYAWLDFETGGWVGPFWRFAAVSSLGCIPPGALWIWYAHCADPPTDDTSHDPRP